LEKTTNKGGTDYANVPRKSTEMLGESREGDHRSTVALTPDQKDTVKKKEETTKTSIR